MSALRKIDWQFGELKHFFGLLRVRPEHIVDAFDGHSTLSDGGSTAFH